MTTDLRDKTVSELVEQSIYSRLNAQELARRLTAVTADRSRYENKIDKLDDDLEECRSRLEEAQEKIVAQQARIDELLILAYELAHDRVPDNVDDVLDRDDNLSALTALKAEVAAKALEETAAYGEENMLGDMDWMRAKAAEYRAKAG